MKQMESCFVLEVQVCYKKKTGNYQTLWNHDWFMNTVLQL